MKKLVWIGCLSYLLIGLAHVVVGAVLADLLQHYGLDYKNGGQLIFLQFFGFLLGVVFTPWWIRHLGKRGLLLVATGTLCAAQIVYSFLPPWEFMLLAAPFAGFGFGVVEAVIGAFVIEAVVERKAVAISRLEVAFGIGALAMPAVASVLILNGLWYWSFPLVAACSLAMFVVWLFISFGSATDVLLRKRVAAAEDARSGKRYERRSLPVLFLMIMFFSVYVGMEMSLVNFLPTMMIEKFATTEALAALSVTLFWSTMIVGRLFAGAIAERINYSRYMLWCCFGGLLLMALLAFSGSIWSSYALILLLGFLLAGIFGIGLVFANHVIPGMTERTTSLLIAAAGTGGALVPLLIGWSMDLYEIRVTMGILVGFALLLSLLMACSSYFSRAFWRKTN